MSYNNIARDYYNPGTDISATTTTAVVGKTFLKIAGPMSGNLMTVTTATAGEHTCGVAKYDAAANAPVGLARGASRIVSVTAGSAITAGSQVQVGENGKAEPLETGYPVGYAIDSVAAGDDAKISLYS